MCREAKMAVIGKCALLGTPEWAITREHVSAAEL